MTDKLPFDTRGLPLVDAPFYDSSDDLRNKIYKFALQWQKMCQELGLERQHLTITVHPHMFMDLLRYYNPITDGPPPNMLDDKFEMCGITFRVEKRS